MNGSQQYYVIGAGGHARVIVSAIESLGGQVIAVLDDNAAKHGTKLAGITVTAPEELLATPHATVVGIGDNGIRQRITQRFQCDWATIIHPTAIVDASVMIGRGSVVMAGAIIQAGTQIGEHCIVNTGATIDHDCRVGDFCHVAPGVNVAGHCELDRGVLVGIGACLVPSVRIGEWTTVGAGAVVVRDLPACVIATGVPARPQRVQKMA